MASSPCPRKSDSNDERELIARLLEDGSVIDQPSPAVTELAKRLEGLGLIKVARREYVRCVNFHDRDIPSRDRSCSGKIYLDDRLDEGGDDYRCPACNRVVYPFRHRKGRFKDIRSNVVSESVLAYLLRELAETKATVKELARGAYRADVGDLGVAVCIVDLCPEKFLAHDWARSQPTCYIGVNARRLRERFLDQDWLVRVPLSEIITGVVRLPDLLQKAVDASRTASVPNASVPVFSRGAPPIVNDSVPQFATPRCFFVELGLNTVRVNGEVIVNPQAGPRYHIFRILLKRFFDDAAEGRAANAFRPMSLQDIVDALGEATDKYYEDVEGVRRTINRLQDDIERTVKQKLGQPIDRDDIIQTCPWKGQGKNDFGYRINPMTVAVRAFRNSENANLS